MSISQITLKQKILIGVMLASAMSAIFSCIVFVKLENNRINEATSRNLNTLIQIVSGNATGALEFGDQDTTMESLNTLKANPHIIGAVIFDINNQVFGSFDRSQPKNDQAKIPRGFPSSAGRDRLEFTDDYIEISRTIKLDGEKLGTIYTRQDLKEIEETNRSLITAATIISILGIAISSVLALFIQRTIVAPINQVVSALKDIAEGDGDLTQRLQVTSKDELGDLANWFNIFIEKIHKVTTYFSETSDELNQSAQRLAETTGKTNQGVVKQQREIDLVASAITQMSGTVQEVRNNVAQSALDAEQADNQAIEGSSIVNKTMESIADVSGEMERAATVIANLQQETDSIGAVIDVIGGIAEQTNLLALNAAIEAARAGEQGRGFAVVADEVRSLASRTQTSTQEIKDMIERLQKGANEAVSVMENGSEQTSSSVKYAEHAGASLTNITEAVTVIKEMSQHISAATQEQSTVTEEINQNIINISQVASQTAEESRIIATGSEELTALANQLRSSISQFKL
jgi:methyl-accepting chemotaxis protein